MRIQWQCGVLALSCCALASAQPRIWPAVRVDAGPDPQWAAEVSVSASGLYGQDVVVGWIDSRFGLRHVGFGISVDGGRSWTEQMVRTPDEVPGALDADPMTATDPRTGTLWAGALGFQAQTGVFVASKASGQTALPPPVQVTTSFTDKGFMAAGPDPNNPGVTRLYVAHLSGLDVSTDLGQSWTTLQPAFGFQAFGVLPRVGPGGELYIVYMDQTDGIWLRRSSDGGVTLQPAIRVATRKDGSAVGPAHVPGSFQTLRTSFFAVDPTDGTLYVTWADTTDAAGGSLNLDVYLTKSENGGNTWSLPRVINGDAVPPGDQFCPWIEVDRTGRLHVVYYDTRRFRQTDADPVAHLDAYYAYSENRGQSWTEAPLTEEPFAYGGTFIGDYLGMGVAGNRAYPAYSSNQRGNLDVHIHVVQFPGQGDFDGDGNVDLADFAAFQNCFDTKGDGGPGSPQCDPGDFDANGAVDLLDFLGFAKKLADS